MKALHKTAFTLLLLGGLNWLLVGAVQWDLSALVGGQGSLAARAFFVLVGLAAVSELVTHKGNCKSCSASEKEESGAPMPPSAPTSA